MSNCIQIESPSETVFTSRELDLSAFLHAVETAKEHTIPWWFFQTNTTRSKSANVVGVAFGQGRSSHTNRDFNAALIWLSQFVINPFEIRFETSDECDGFELIGTEIINFEPRKVKRTGWMKEWVQFDESYNGAH